MTDKTLTRLGICEAIYIQIGLSRKDSLDIVQNILEKKANSPNILALLKYLSHNSNDSP